MKKLLSYLLGIILISFTINVGYSMELKSTAFKSNETIPLKYTCDGEDISPPLQWSDVPAGTKSFVLIMDDPDAPSGTWDHWILFNMPSQINSLEENAKTLPQGTNIGKNSWQRTIYNGPCPPDREHRYFFKLYALDTLLTLPSDASKQDIETKMMGHIIGEATLVGRYKRQ